MRSKAVLQLVFLTRCLHCDAPALPSPLRAQFCGFPGAAVAEVVEEAESGVTPPRALLAAGACPELPLSCLGGGAGLRRVAAAPALVGLVEEDESGVTPPRALLAAGTCPELLCS